MIPSGFRSKKKDKMAIDNGEISSVELSLEGHKWSTKIYLFIQDFVTSLSFLKKRLASAFTGSLCAGYIPYHFQYLLRDSRCHEIQVFHELSSPKPLKITLGSFQIFSKIRGDIHKSRRTTGI